MVTGDHVQTATAIAKECGILKKDFVLDGFNNVVMEGKKFREMVGGLKSEKDGDGKEVKKIVNI
jgi:Ca2+ transporting ATPase